MKLLNIFKQFIDRFKRDRTVYYCDYCGGTTSVYINFISKLNICSWCKKKAFDKILKT